MKKIDFKNLTSKQILIVLFPIVVVFFVIIYLPDKKKVKTKQEDMIIDPTVKGTNEELKKTEAYEKAIKKINEEKELKQKQQSSDFYSLVNEISKKDTIIKKEDVVKQEKVTINKFYNLPKKRHKKSRIKHKEKEQDKRKETLKTFNNKKNDKKKSEPKKQYYSFYSKEKSYRKKKKIVSLEDQNYFLGVLEKSKKLTDGMEVSFLLRREFEYQKKVFKKFSLLIGVAQFQNNRIFININIIKTRSGQIYAVNMDGYNENFQKGIYYQGYSDKRVKDVKNNSIDDISDNSQVGYSQNVVQNVATNLASETAKSFKKPVSIFIKKGYKMYFKISQNEK